MDEDPRRGEDADEEKDEEEGHPEGDTGARHPTDEDDTPDEDAVDEASRDSFPSSDPPAY